MMRVVVCAAVLVVATMGVAAPAQAAPAQAGAYEPTDSHPNPSWARPWVSLNGAWRFDFDPQDAGVREQWNAKHAYSKSITVPYPWQSRLSGIADVNYNGAAWYERDITLPPDCGPRVFLVFGAVDWQATVWVNGKERATHEGGYTPFEVELTPEAKPGETVRVTVRAFDVTDDETPTGKQTGWYTQTGGIWQSVYLESRGASYLRSAQILTDIKTGKVTFRCTVEAAKAGAYTIRAAAAPGIEGFADKAARVDAATVACDLKAGANTVEVELSIADPQLWTPDNPALYDACVALKEGAGNVSVKNGVMQSAIDTVDTYFGLRALSTGRYGDSGFEYILLNGKPIYLRGALHQSFNPEGIYTHPDDAFIRRDYEKAKAFGLNFIRIHIKVEEPRCLYWADRLGVMLMCDMPNYTKHTPRSQKLWEETLRAAIARDFNHPSVFAWCCFNETWGIGDGGYDRAKQEWVRDMYRLAKQLDPTRLVEDNSACNYDHVETDINSWHFYIDDFDAAKKHVDNVIEKTLEGSPFNYAEGWKQGTAPLINSEYGGVGCGNGDRDISWVFLFLTNLLRAQEKCGGYVYTELEDIEWEHNGFMNYDRSDKEYHYPGDASIADITVADLQAADVPVLDGPPYQRVKAGAHVSIPVSMSHWSDREGLQLRMTAVGETVDGRAWSQWIAPQERAVQATPYRVTSQGTFEFDLPDARGILNVVVEALSEGKRCGATYSVLDVRDGAAWAAPAQFAASFPVQALASCTLNSEACGLSADRAKVGGCGGGAIEYKLRLPKDLKAEDLKGARLIAELGSKADTERLDWPARRNPADYPQTDGKKWPSDVVIALNGQAFFKATLADDAADARGVLSHEAKFHHGSHGEVVNAPIEGEALGAIKKALAGDRMVVVRFEVPADAAHVGGLALYGADMGAYPADPTFVFELNTGAAKPAGAIEAVDTLASRELRLIEPGPNGQRWRYTTEQPGEQWAAPDFDDAAWKEGAAGFGTEGTPGARLGTKWTTGDIWLRTTVKIDANVDASSLALRLHHDEDVEVFVNGQALLTRTGYRNDYERIALTAEQRALFKLGKDILIAVHCHQTSGGQFVDLAITALKKASTP